MAVLACSSSYWGDRGERNVSSRPAWASWRNLVSNNLSESTVQWQIIYLSMHRAWVELLVLLKEKSNQNKIIVIIKKNNPTLSCQDVSQDERLTAKSDDLRLILGTRLDKGENCFLPIVLWSLHDCYGTCMCTHVLKCWHGHFSASSSHWLC